MHSRDLLRQRTFREIMFLQELNDHDNIIRRAGGGGKRRASCTAPPEVACLRAAVVCLAFRPTAALHYALL